MDALGLVEADGESEALGMLLLKLIHPASVVTDVLPSVRSVPLFA